MNKQIADRIAVVLKQQITGGEEILSLLEKPKSLELGGDVAFPCFTLAKVWKQSPQSIAAQIASQLNHDSIERVQAVGGYVNIFLAQQQVTQQVLSKILRDKQQYGTISTKMGTVVLDFSSPNIAKPFSMGHLRSTVIGNALANIAEKNGYQAIRINHLGGDWGGTQFGKLIVAYQLWGGTNRLFQRHRLRSC